MADEKTPDRLDALLAIVNNPKAAQKLADQMAELEAAKAELEKQGNEIDNAHADLADRIESLDRIEAEQARERDRQAAAEKSLEDRAGKIKAGEDELQAKVVAHGQAHGKQSAELNTREQNVAAREADLEELEAQLKADREALDKKLAAAKAFVAAA